MQNAMSNMIEGQIRPNGVNNPQLISALTKIDRSCFIPKEYEDTAYADMPIFFNKNSDTKDRFTLPPLSISKLIQALDVNSNNSVLDLYCNCGYSTALLAFISKRVIGYEPNKKISEFASSNLLYLDIYNASIESDVKKISNKKTAEKFDRILINGALKEIPAWLFDVLNCNGHLIAPSPIIGNISAINLYKKKDDKINKERIFDLIVPEITV